MYLPTPNPSGLETREDLPALLAIVRELQQAKSDAVAEYDVRIATVERQINRIRQEAQR